MTQAKNGDTVYIHLTGRLANGTVFATSENRAPLELVLGEGRVLPGVDRAVVGMQAGASKSVAIPAEEAYGDRREELVRELGQDQIGNLAPEVGDELEVRQPDGERVIVRVVSVSESSVTVDGNHRLAGEDLTFDIELVSIA
jgi:peptidylprolyl isomerase